MQSLIPSRCGRRIVLLSLWALSFDAASASAQTPGCLVQKALPQGCVTNGGAGGCTSAFGMEFANGVAVSPDGGTVYVCGVLGAGGDAVAVLDRNTSNGVLAPLPGTTGCASHTGSGGLCSVGIGLDGAESVVVSPDGENVYVGASSAIVVFDRNTITGAITQKAGTAGCISNSGSGGACVDGESLVGLQQVVISPDGDNVYAVASNTGALLVFDRNPATGALTQKAGAAGCIRDVPGVTTCGDGRGLASASGVEVSSDGSHVYVAGANSSSIAIFDRDAGTGALTQKAGTAGCVNEDGSDGCADGQFLVFVTRTAISPDGNHLYAVAGLTSSSDTLTVFDRNAASGEITQKAGQSACHSASGSGGLCTVTRGFLSPRHVQVSADGMSVYVSLEDSDGVAVFDRNAATGLLTQRPGLQGCVNGNGAGGCAIGTVLTNSIFFALSPDDANLYVSSAGDDGIAVFDRESCTTTTTTSTTTSTTLPPGPCAIAPRGDCREGFGRARLSLRRGVEDSTRDSVDFVWKRGEATALLDFGDPVEGDTEYTLCVYDSLGLQFDALVAPGGTCGTRPCWEALGERGLEYLDREASGDGIKRLLLRAGIDGETRISLEGRGAALGVPTLPLADPLVVQIVASEGLATECWDATFPVSQVRKAHKVDAVVR